MNETVTSYMTAWSMRSLSVSGIEHQKAKYKIKPKDRDVYYYEI